jgi:hypothetical protein
MAAILTLVFALGCAVATTAQQAEGLCADSLRETEHRVSASELPDGPDSPVLRPCPHTAADPAIRQDCPAPNVAGDRQSGFAVPPSSSQAPFRQQLPFWLRQGHPKGTALARPSVQVLFCTWLI